MIFGARRARPTFLRRLIARAAARELDAFVVPGLEVARARGLDLAAAGLRPSVTPRHASVLVLVGGLPVGLKKAAAVAYAQMPRPRAILAVGAGDVSPLPEPDVSVPLGQEELAGGVAALRRVFAEGAFSTEAEDFDVDEIRTQTEYVCPMHPDVVRDEPGSCPKCGMDLVPREAASSGGDHGHAGHEGMDHGQAAHSRGDSEREGSGHDAAAVDRNGSGGETGTEYACPMHPEVARAEPGSCPVCGMDLVAREEADEGTGHGANARVEHGRHEGSSSAEHDEHHGHAEPDHGGDAQAAGGEGAPGSGYTCPMHPEVVRDETGSCPVCGMDLVPRDGAEAHHGGHAEAEHEDPGAEHGSDGEHGAAEHGEAGDDHEGHGAEGDGEHEGMEHGDHEGDSEGSGGHEGHGGMDHGDDMGFMSMVAMTEGTPRSSDGLQMEWVETPFGPLFPGLPGGLSLTLTLDGDTVAQAEAEPGIQGWAPEGLAGPVETFPDRLARLDPLSPVAYRMLACRAVGDAAGAAASEESGRAGALERERAASHLNWLSEFGHLLGDRRVARRAGKLQLALLRAEDAGEVVRLEAGVREFLRRLERAPGLRRRLRGIGILPSDAEASGPVARAAGSADDARADDAVYVGLGFAPVVREGNDALSRLLVRLAEIVQSLGLVRASGSISAPDRPPDPAASGTGTATVETPRGRATLSLILKGGTVVAFELDTPSTKHLNLLKPLAEGEELADALVGISSLDLSPWGVIG